MSKTLLNNMVRLSKATSALCQECQPLTQHEIAKPLRKRMAPLVLGAYEDGGLLVVQPTRANDEGTPHVKFSTDQSFVVDAGTWLEVRAYVDSFFRDEIPYVEGAVLEEAEDALRGVMYDLEVEEGKAEAKRWDLNQKRRDAEEPFVPNYRKPLGPLFAEYEAEEARLAKELAEKKLADEKAAAEEEAQRAGEADRQAAEQMAEAVENGEVIEDDPPVLPPDDQPEPVSALAGVNAGIAKALGDAGVVKTRKPRNGKTPKGETAPQAAQNGSGAILEAPRDTRESASPENASEGPLSASGNCSEISNSSTRSDFPADLDTREKAASDLAELEAL